MSRILPPRFLTLLALAVLAIGLSVSAPASAQDTDKAAPAPAATSSPVTEVAAAPAASTDTATEQPAKPKKKFKKKRKKAPAKATSVGYFVEFRSRTALSYGHTFLVHGRLDAKGNITTSEVAGLHPAGDDPTPWVIGHIIPVVSETGASDGDTEDQYISAAYRIVLTAEQYQRVSAFIRTLQKNSPMWHAVLYNCNSFVADVAHYMGLETPGTLAYPKEFINGIKEMNGARTTMNENASRKPIFMGKVGD